MGLFAFSGHLKEIIWKKFEKKTLSLAYFKHLFIFIISYMFYCMWKCRYGCAMHTCEDHRTTSRITSLFPPCWGKVSLVPTALHTSNWPTSFLFVLPVSPEADITDACDHSLLFYVGSELSGNHLSGPRATLASTLSKMFLRFVHVAALTYFLWSNNIH